LARLSKHLIEQRHFFPLYPSTARENLPRPTAVSGAAATDNKATGAMLDTSYLALGEWPLVRPDVLITPSTLPPFAKVVKRVLVVNPGTLSKKRGPGTFAQITIEAAKVSEEDRKEDRMVGHELFERARVDLVRI
ncbi:hypothetical protein E9104_22500, partial [Salmonella enterica subsp. enterica serovar Goldcoast]|uniref:hypothetical protein n=1 Tax=Salmonella enterica TaxID=28901 RepID=UPI001123D678